MNLLASLRNSGNALDVLQHALSVVQNNVSNASTAGYATQQLNVVAQPFDIASGAAGGIASRGLLSSRDAYADSEVQRQAQTLGLYTAQSQSTGVIQSLFDVSGNSGVSAALTKLFTSFSAWSASPNDAVARQTVISAAASLANSISGIAKGLNTAARQLNQQIGSTASQINDLAAQIQRYNMARRQQTEADPGADAQLHSTLESLSQLSNFTALTQADGTVTVLLGGGSPLVIGDQLDAVSTNTSVDPAAANPQSQPTAHVLDSQGKDITADITGGQLGGLLDTRNRVLSSIIGDGQQAGTLNQFAKGLADSINNILTSGTVSTAANAAAGIPLFTYDNADATLASGSITVNAAVTGDQLAPVDAAGNANGNANLLASLGDPSNVQGQIAGVGFAAYFGGIAALAGQANQDSQSNLQAQQQVLAQATSQRDHISGVSLDAQAAEVLQFQRAYQAVARVLGIINSLADSALGIIPQI